MAAAVSANFKDQNGFTLQPNVVDVYREFFVVYKDKLRRRKKRWDALHLDRANTSGIDMLNHKKLIRKGIPHEIRGLVWSLSCGSDSLMQKNKGLYHKIAAEAAEKSKKNELPCADQIEMDLHRTFPEHEKFARTSVEGEAGLGLLRKLLLAYSFKNPKVGYCQGMNFVAAYLLLNMDDERAFWTLSVMIERVLPEAYYSESMAGCMIDQKVFQDIIHKRLPILSAHMEKIGMVIELGCLQWFLCLFSRTFPSETVMRCWDSLFLEGTKILFRLGLAVLHRFEAKLLQTNDAHEFCVSLQSVGALMVDCDSLMKEAFRLRNFRRRTIERLRAKYRGPLTQEMEAEVAERAARNSQIPLSPPSQPKSPQSTAQPPIPPPDVPRPPVPPPTPPRVDYQPAPTPAAAGGASKPPQKEKGPAPPPSRKRSAESESTSSSIDSCSEDDLDEEEDAVVAGRHPHHHPKISSPSVKLALSVEEDAAVNPQPTALQTQSDDESTEDDSEPEDVGPKQPAPPLSQKQLRTWMTVTEKAVEESGIK